MDAKKIDIINIFLIIISLIIAIRIPFDLFLFAYPILGPLHYLTEIAWLQKKNYFFSTNKNWSFIFVILTILMSIYPFIQYSGLRIHQSLENIIQFINTQSYTFLLIGFLFAVSFLFFKKIKDLTLALIFIILFSFILTVCLPDLIIFIGVFLPTLIHVYVFTLFFILYGALKSKSNYGFYLGILLFIVPFILWYLPINYINYKPSKDTMENFVSNNLIILSNIIAQLLNELQDGKFHVLSEVGLKIQIFISFAYTYHYLNWFSKTSIIGWRKAISKKTAFLILSIWILSIGLYIYDFKTGFNILLSLSLLHLLLEFPLNIITIKEILLLTKSKDN